MPKSKTARVYSKTIDGAVRTQVAGSAADEVRFTFDGWRDITDEVAKAAEVAKQFPAGGAAKPADTTKPAK